MKKIFLSFVLLCVTFFASAIDLGSPLPSYQAFAFTAKYNENKMLQLDWNIAPDYYLYQSSIKVEAADGSPIKVGKFYFPDTMIFEGRKSYTGHLNLQVPIKLNGAKMVNVNVEYQGCSGKGYCYAPVFKAVHINVANPSDIKQQTVVPASNQQDRIVSFISNHSLAWVLLAFVVFGVLLTFTPCVLPMIPILSGIIVGHGKNMTTAHAFRLSLVYVIGMALTYAVAGVLIALLGSQVQAALQSPPVIIVFALIFVLLSLSLFGFYELRLPRWFEERIAIFSRKQKSGSYIGVFIMGILSTLIVSPCVSAPLVGVLIYIAKTGDVILGAMSLFALGIGMGIPLLIVGTSAGRLLPSTGKWMNAVKSIFGVLLIAVAILMLSRILPDLVTFTLWAVLAIVCSIYMGALAAVQTGFEKLWKGLGLVFLVYGIALLIGVLQGNPSFTRPLSLGTITTKLASSFISVNSVEQVEKQLALAKSSKQPVLLDFSAKWCEDCQVMNRTTFSDAQVLAALRGYRLVRVDLTANDAATHALRQKFNVVGTPTQMFYDSKGQLMNQFTHVGSMGATAFAALVTDVSRKAF